MTTIAVRFLTGRYHATPWGHHVNEGLPEWPPSPWRLLRALVAACKRSSPEVSDQRLARLLSRLVEPPAVALPVASFAMTRHWMPWYKKGPRDRTLVFDTFTAFAAGAEVQFQWPTVKLDREDQELLASILANVTYLGRAESWVEAHLASEPFEPNCLVLGPGAEPPVDYTAVETLAPVPNEPGALLQAVLTDTGTMHSQNRLLPRGSQWIRYARPDQTLLSDPIAPPTRHRSEPVQLIRFAVSGKPRPLLTEAVRFGELAKQALMGVWGKAHQGEVPAVLSGHELGSALGHQHAFFLPEDQDRDGRIDHLTIWAPKGLEEAEVERLLSRLWLFRSRWERELSLVILGHWTATDLTGPGTPLPIAAVWVSETPFVLTRYPKRHRTGVPKLTEWGEQKDGPADQIRREWSLRQIEDPSLPDLLAVEYVPYLDRQGRRIQWLQFRRWRERGTGASSGFAHGLELRFAGPVRGPLTFGYARHFGLGQFRPES